MTNSPGFLGKLRARILVAHNHAGIVERIGNLLALHFDVVARISDGLAAVDATAFEARPGSAGYDYAAKAWNTSGARVETTRLRDQEVFLMT